MIRGIACIKACTGPFTDEVLLDYEDRHRRRVMMCGNAGTRFLLDLSDVPDMRDGDGIKLSSGHVVRVRSALEPLMEFRCPDAKTLVRIAWHIGNRHVPAEIREDGLRIRADTVIATMVQRLGGRVRSLEGAFNPEPGAYATAHNRDHSHE